MDGSLDADDGDIAGSTRVSDHAPWTFSIMSDNDPVAPEPESWIMWMVLALGLFVYARKVRKTLLVEP